MVPTLESLSVGSKSQSTRLMVNQCGLSVAAAARI